MVKKLKVQRRDFDDAFKREAVRILATSGRKVEQVAKDLGVARSTLSKWKSQLNEADLLAGPHDDVQKELARLRRENELLRIERDLLKNDRGTGPPVGRETDLPYACGGRERPIAFWWRKTPLKNMVHGL
jgi:transposase